MSFAEERDESECFQDCQSEGMGRNTISNSDMGIIDLDSMMEVVQSEQEDQGLDDMTNKIKFMSRNKSETLLKIQQYGVELKSAIDSSKYKVTELGMLRDEEQEKEESRKTEMDGKRLELEELKLKKVDGIAHFENSVNETCGNFIEGPKEYDTNTLQQYLDQLQKVLSGNITELKQYKEEMIQENDKFEQITSDDGLTSIYKIFDENVTDIDSLNKKLKEEVAKLSTEVNRAQVKFNFLTKLN